MSFNNNYQSCRPTNQQCQCQNSINFYCSVPDLCPRYYAQDVPYKTDIIIGHFNPDDNKSQEEILRECCDPCWKNCKPSLPPYPCRVAIRYPEQRMKSCFGNENRNKYPSICEDFCPNKKKQ